MLCLTESPSQAETPVAQTVIYVHDINCLIYLEIISQETLLYLAALLVKLIQTWKINKKVFFFFMFFFLFSVNHFDRVVTLRCSESRQAASRISSTDPKTASNTLHFYHTLLHYGLDWWLSTYFSLTLLQALCLLSLVYACFTQLCLTCAAWSTSHHECKPLAPPCHWGARWIFSLQNAALRIDFKRQSGSKFLTGNRRWIFKRWNKAGFCAWVLGGRPLLSCTCEIN